MDEPGPHEQHDQPFDAPPVSPAPLATPEPAPLATPEPAVYAAPAPIAHEAPAAKRTGSALAWVVAAVAAIAAVVLGVLWAGASSDVDDTKAAKAAIAADLADTQAKVDDLQGQLDDAKGELDTAQSDLDTAVDAKGAIQADLDDAKAEIEQLQAAVNNNDISDEVALSLGRSFTDGANPPLTDAEATCMGHTFYDEIGLGLLLEVGISQDITPDQARQAFDALFTAADTCNVDIDRLPA